MKFDADVNPVTQKWLSDRIDEGAKYDALVILLDTPGGLDTSMRKIVQDELAAKEPVVVYVAPNGARAASAGVWIAQAADVLAMSPVSNIGSSTPITGNGAEHRQRPQAQDRQRRRRLASQPRARARTQREVGRPRRSQGLEPDGGRGAADERGRRDRAEPADAAAEDRRPHVEGAQTSRSTPPATRS